MGEFMPYPHKLFDLKVEEVRTIVGNTFEFSYDILEDHIPELITEIKAKAGVDSISDTTINQAIEAVDNQIKTINKWFDHRMQADKWVYTKDRASKNYLKGLNEIGALVFVYRNATKQGKGTVISIPLYLALTEMAVAVFDYSLSKSGELKYKLKKSNDCDRKKILNIKSKASLKYYFVRVLKKSGISSRQIIRNMSTVFGTDVNKAIASSDKLPDLFR